MKKIILASASPRRKELLTQIGMKFEVIKSGCEEKCTKTKPEELVVELATQKAEDVMTTLVDRQEEILVIGADTVVAYRGEILGKPKDKEDAIRMLNMLQGNTHQVFTGVALYSRENGKVNRQSFYEETKVTMYPMTDEEIENYVSTGEVMDKAGAYAIQGKCAAFIKKIDGDYNNVVGLPISRIYQEIKKSPKEGTLCMNMMMQ